MNFTSEDNGKYLAVGGDFDVVVILDRDCNWCEIYHISLNTNTIINTNINININNSIHYGYERICCRAIEWSLSGIYKNTTPFVAVLKTILSYFQNNQFFFHYYTT
jgi:hypothetical protein